MSRKNFFGVKGIIDWARTSSTPPEDPAARELINTYNNNGRALMSHEGKKVSGFCFERRDLEALLSNNNVQRVMFALGYHDGTRGNHIESHTLVLIGVSNATEPYDLMITPGVDIVYDFCDPIPPSSSNPQLSSI